MSDFIAKVKEAEQKAAEIIEKALKNKQDELLKYEKDLAEKEIALEKSLQEKMKNDLQKSRLDSRKKYEEKVAEGVVAANKIKSSKEGSIEGFVSLAESVFLQSI